MSRTFAPPAECPVCGEAVPRKARACPNCGACEKSGWSDADEDRFDYDSFVSEEFGAGNAKSGKEWFWWIVSAAVLIGFALVIASRIF